VSNDEVEIIEGHEILPEAFAVARPRADDEKDSLSFSFHPMTMSSLGMAAA